MVNEPAQMNEMLEYGRFAPAGGRGYFSVSRAVQYGVFNTVIETQQNLNRELSLMAQIETVEAVNNLDELAAVPGIDLFVGPADLAASLGHPGQTLHPSVREAAGRIVKAARANGKCIVSACGPSDFKFWLDQKIDLLFCTNDIACLKRGASLALQEARSILDDQSSPSNGTDPEKAVSRNGVGIA
jgi:2-keto-3-deoxy-L-rhamnonate aldolase RhmA